MDFRFYNTENLIIAWGYIKLISLKTDNSFDCMYTGAALSFALIQASRSGLFCTLLYSPLREGRMTGTPLNLTNRYCVCQVTISLWIIQSFTFVNNLKLTTLIWLSQIFFQCRFKDNLTVCHALLPFHLGWCINIDSDASLMFCVW